MNALPEDDIYVPATAEFSGICHADMEREGSSAEHCSESPSVTALVSHADAREILFFPG